MWYGLRILLREKPLWPESELQTQRQRFNKRRTIWPVLKLQDWYPESTKRRSRRCWLLSDTVWVILQVLTLGRMRKTWMMKRLSRASWAKMMNPAGWWGQLPKLYSSAWRYLGRSRWSSKSDSTWMGVCSWLLPWTVKDLRQMQIQDSDSRSRTNE